ncbi:MAG: hypothetical protein Fur0014_12070 [Rubrivivax sp.]
MSPTAPGLSNWPAFKAGALRAFHRYASWLVGITWTRFVLLSVLLIVIAAITQSLPPFSYTVTEEVEEPIELPELPPLPKPPKPPKPAQAPEASKTPPVIQIEKPAPGASAPDGVDISIDGRGIRIRPRQAAGSASAASAAGEAGVHIELPGSATKEIVQEAIDEARQAVREAAQARREAQQDADAAAREAQEAARAAIEQARQALKDAGLGGTRKVKRQRVVHWGDFLTDLALIWIVASAIIKMVYKGRIQAEVKAAQATETAEAESLKRQVVEARMAAMQAQVEPHFLFNTLASIDHLIETDPPRASQMQKNLIALLRASMPTMREAGGANGGLRDLGRELAVIRPYLEILKVRMEERLTTEIDVPEGLQSAEFPPMMIQTLVENAIKHGLEPKAEGGHLRVKAEVLHGKLAVSVADTGLGFGKAATAGTGVGLANIRERLQLLYGPKASVAVTENQPSGTVVTITVPYKPIEEVNA